MTKTGRTYPDLIAEHIKIVIVIIILFFVILIWLIFSETFFKIGNVEVGSKPKTSIDSIKSDSSIKISGKQNVNGNGNIIINNSVQQNTVNKLNEYSIAGTSNQSLINQISNKRNIKFVSISNNKIEISYTGTINLVEKNSNAYYYSGGHIKVMINEHNCFEFEEFKIDEMRPNSKNQILNEIQNSIDKYVNSNVGLFSKKITECLKN